MAKCFALDFPRRVYFGPGSATKIGEAAANLCAASVLVVSDLGVQKAGLGDGILGDLRAAGVHFETMTADQLEPTAQSIDETAGRLEQLAGFDALIAVGGGSVIDAAKCINVVAMNGGSINDYDYALQPPRAIQSLLPFIAVPTTSGTGSEASIWAVFIDSKRKLKTSAADPRLIPSVVILDPQLTRTLPAKLTAGTGMDALTHCLEAFVSSYANPLSDCLAAQAIELIAQNLRAAVRDGQDTEARTNLMMGSYLAGSAFSNSSCGLVHSMAESMGGYYLIPHGITNALMLPFVMEFNLSAAEQKYAQIAGLLGEDVGTLCQAEAARASVEAVRRLSRDIGLPQSLKEVGVLRQDIPSLVKLAYSVANISGNPKMVTEQELATLYERAY